ncbi:unannotated protein [freshwater metagenome]|uniref:Unannotated protein n=1 Tax=freshwater metagenome TaxID=449393 RepID=A0A6J6P6M0_9ZZZZ
MGKAVPKSDGGDNGVEPFLIRSATSEIHRKRDVLECGQCWHKVECLEHETNRVAAHARELLVVQATQVDIADEDSPCIDGVKTGNAMHEG